MWLTSSFKEQMRKSNKLAQGAVSEGKMCKTMSPTEGATHKSGWEGSQDKLRKAGRRIAEPASW